MHDDLRERVRVAAGRASVSTAAVIDSQSVKGLEMTGRARRGSDAGKKIYGIRRYLAVDVPERLRLGPPSSVVSVSRS